ncbi:TlpA family protein disulfide reductase [Flavivirga spongiicola]|uniref:TlpA family protein disulfide reductase n=1 Tax=Flavivirga spongiicola TaxID=421621 RepID=A0ABU7XSB9_9FLAO|nr:TlpA disulfide reductase family protein [Flavivirga sp. MEBiC05379]MDO5977834.1 TlpA disulfide reductase family protein [Flavivirga sp. MEBiC05379]
MKKSIYIIILTIFSFSCKEIPTKKNKTVILKGSIVNYDQDTLYMGNVSSKFMLFKEDIQSFPLQDKTDFEYRFELDKPTYFQIGRTFLYLSPGDSLVVNLDTRDRTYASFSGKGAEANNYLRNVPYPKGGSFWGDRDISSKIKTFEDMPEAFKQSIDNRMLELNGLTNVSEDFKRLEKARSKFDYVNSLNNLFYLYYGKVRKGEMTQEEMNVKIEEANKYLIPFKKPFLDDFNDTNYLQLEVFQSLLYSLKEKDFKTIHELPALNTILQDYLVTNELVNTLKFNGYSNQIGDQLKEGIQEVTNQDYRAVLQNLQAEYETITKGNPASDLTFTKLDGNTIKLSDYKGKVIVLDLWATWCGPCMKEKPFFEDLEKVYHRNNNVELISLSIDTEKVWRGYFEKNEVVGNQLQINRSQLSDYKVAGIPRFFVIDKNFNIVDVFAPLPSSGELEKLINKYI